MRTTKPISTISFNYPLFLALKLEEWRKAKIITWWCYVYHIAEDDEQGLKDHIHLFVEPAKLVQTEDLREQLRELDPNHDKPLGCLAWESSKFDHWYMYVLHDKAYLASKGQSRQFHYRYDDLVTCDEDELLHRSRRIDHLSLSPYRDMQDAIANGITWQEYFARGTIPIPQLRAWQTAWELLCAVTPYRNDRKGHDDAQLWDDCSAGSRN